MIDRVQVNDVVQIDPEVDGMFGGCLMIVTEVKLWGVQGYVQIPGQGEAGGQAYYRCKFGDFEFIGHACWIADRVNNGE